MIFEVSDQQHAEYLSRLWMAIKTAKSYKELKLLSPSVVIVQKQLTPHRAFAVACMLQDYNQRLLKWKHLE